MQFFLKIQWGFEPPLPPPSGYASDCGLFPHTMDARDRHNGQRDKRTNKRTDGRTDEETRRVSSSVRLSLRWSFDTYRSLAKLTDEGICHD